MTPIINIISIIISGEKTLSYLDNLPSKPNLHSNHHTSQLVDLDMAYHSIYLRYSLNHSYHMSCHNNNHLLFIEFFILLELKFWKNFEIFELISQIITHFDCLHKENSSMNNKQCMNWLSRLLCNWLHSILCHLNLY